jgi:hypothetical protein
LRTLVILPAEPIEPQELARCLRLCRQRFQPRGPVAIVAPAATLAAYRQARPDDAIGSDLPERREAADILVYVQCDNQRPEKLAAAAGQRVYALAAYPNLRGGLGPLELVAPARLDAFEYPHLETHIFNRLGSREGGFTNFPFGVLYLDPLSGPIDPFGFRIDFDWRTLADRPADHKLVAIFGGSAAFSCSCAHDEMFAHQLEGRLNAKADKPGGANRWTVLNFGMHDNVMMQEMLTYLMFVDRLRPEIVIAHDGHNDLWYGLGGDPFLVAGHQLVYQRHAEQWSRLLHKTEDRPIPDISSCEVGAQQFNLPPNILAAYIARKRQFQSLVERQGGIFLWGFQPMITSRRALSPAEEGIRDAIPKRATAPEVGRFFVALFHVYEMLHQALIRLDGIRLVDFHALFQSFDAGTSLMTDHIHCTPAGDAAIAAAYERAIHDALSGDGR